MIEITETYNCEQNDCGRKFQTKDDLLSHYQRRHNDLYEKYKTILKIEYKETQSSGKVRIITEEIVGVGTKYACLDEIEELNLDNKNISVFKNMQNVDFTDLFQLLSLNISHNHISNIEDLSILSNLKVLNISHNNIDDITPLQYLEDLEVLNAENNKIGIVSSLNKCKRLYKLELAHNNLYYKTSTLKIFEFLNFKELTIANNPFLNEIIGYKHLFIHKFIQLKKLDGENVQDIDRDIARNFLIQSNQTELIVPNRPNTAKGVLGLKELSKSKLEESDIRITEKKVITKVNYENKLPPKQYNVYEELDRIKKENEKLTKENKQLNNKVIDYEKEIESLKLELENVSTLKDEYENIIYKKDFKLQQSNTRYYKSNIVI
jgi:hypothetical protein